jgi:hypothetical protein
LLEISGRTAASWAPSSHDGAEKKEEEGNHEMNEWLAGGCVDVTVNLFWSQRCTFRCAGPSRALDPAAAPNSWLLSSRFFVRKQLRPAAAAAVSARTASRRAEFAPKLTLPGPIPAAGDTPSGAAAAQRARERLSERTSRRTSGMDGEGIKLGGWPTLALRSRMHLTSSWPHHLWLLSVTAFGGHFWKRPAWLLQVPAALWIQSLVLPPTHSLALSHATLPRPSRARLLCCCSVIRAGLLAPLHLTSPHLLPPFRLLISTSPRPPSPCLHAKSTCRRTVIALPSHCHSQLAFRLALRLRCTPASSTTYAAIWHTHLESVLRLASTPSSLSWLVLDSRIAVPTRTSPSSASPASARYAWADIEVAKVPTHAEPAPTTSPA